MAAEPEDAKQTEPNRKIAIDELLQDPLPGLHRWLVEQSLPLWGEVGWDAETGLFVERLDTAGRPLAEVPRRLMVQARQIYAFGVAARRGWYRNAEERVERAADAMVRCYFGPDGCPGWCFSVDRAGSVLDSSRDLYSLSFVLLALATLVGAGRVKARRLADETLVFLDHHMAHPLGGYVDALPVTIGQPLRQNPHMHLFEALLALHEAAPDGDYLDRARKIAGLLKHRFLHGHPPVLAEYFDHDWALRGEPDVPFEPGHHFEWVWLLGRYAQLSGTALHASSEPLWSTAISTGLSPQRLIYDQVSLDRGALRRSTRLWPYCEAAKAAHTRAGEATIAGDFLDHLQRRFLRPAYRGGWIDRLDFAERPMTDYIPASSLYHICCAADVVAEPRPS